MDNVIDYVHHETTHNTPNAPLAPAATPQAPKVTAAPTEADEEATLRDTVSSYLEKYTKEFGEDTPKHLYKEMLKLIEKPLLVGIMKFTRSNQSRAAKLLNISRGTLRKKLKVYGLL